MRVCYCLANSTKPLYLSKLHLRIVLRACAELARKKYPFLLLARPFKGDLFLPRDHLIYLVVRYGISWEGSPLKDRCQKFTNLSCSLLKIIDDRVPVTFPFLSFSFNFLIRQVFFRDPSAEDASFPADFRATEIPPATSQRELPSTIVPRFSFLFLTSLARDSLHRHVLVPRFSTARSSMQFESRLRCVLR